MQVKFELPEEIAQTLESRWKDLNARCSGKSGTWSLPAPLRLGRWTSEVLGFETRIEVDALLKDHEVYDFTAADFEQDRETLRQLRASDNQPW